MKGKENGGFHERLTSNGLTLLPGTYLVEGAKNGIICDTNTGNVYSLNAASCDILLGKAEGQNFWNELEKLGLATREETPSSSENLKRPINLDFVWFEIVTDDCNERCAHCYADSMPATYRKNLVSADSEFIPLEAIKVKNAGQAVPQPEKRKLNHNNWLELIDTSYELGARSCQFIGGEPFLYKGENGETVLDLAKRAKDKGFELIEIFTNGTMITADKVEKIEELGLNIAISLYSIDAKVHEAVTRTPGSFQKTMRALDLLKEAGIPIRVETVLMKTNQDTLRETEKWIREMGFNHRGADVLRLKGRGSDNALQPDKEIIVENSFMTEPNFHAERDFFQRNISGHSCLAGKITITEFSDVLPCIFTRNFTLGNVINQPLEEVVESKTLRTVWESTKDSVLVCQDCEYRYVCFDCRPISEAVNQGKGEYLTAPYPRCTHNPYTGEWAHGVWRLDQTGKPYYDTTLEETIQKIALRGGNSNLPRGH